MKRYIKPEIKAQRIELENCVLAGSTDVPISEDPATGPALSKGNIFGDDDEEESNSDRSSSSLWDN
ncbi:toxin PIN [Prevotella sp. A2931]|uniref:Toxin PIN n=1 Tax=Prevotella illustrans TaxID=2800387 RepID=A0ABS3M2U7_9BACT|nr:MULTISPECIES: toxin PIN [Prevotella]MBO1362472.1 toxin PIN [Prevotella illustrans]PTL25019.1 toxin PIN [Prevotella sp. oral taxon 820]